VSQTKLRRFQQQDLEPQALIAIILIRKDLATAVGSRRAVQDVSSTPPPSIPRSDQRDERYL